VSSTFGGIVGDQQAIEIASVLKYAQLLHKHLTAVVQEVLFYQKFCLSFIFPFYKY